VRLGFSSRTCRRLSQYGCDRVIGDLHSSARVRLAVLVGVGNERRADVLFPDALPKCVGQHSGVDRINRGSLGFPAQSWAGTRVDGARDQSACDIEIRKWNTATGRRQAAASGTAR